MGKELKKLQYVEYTDKRFTKRAERADQWEHLGLLGPTLEAQVRIVFEHVRNQLMAGRRLM